MFHQSLSYWITDFYEMDPFRDVFSFIKTNDLKEEKEVRNIHKKNR